MARTRRTRRPTRRVDYLSGGVPAPRSGPGSKKRAPSGTAIKKTLARRKSKPAPKKVGLHTAAKRGDSAMIVKAENLTGGKKKAAAKKAPSKAGTPTKKSKAEALIARKKLDNKKHPKAGGKTGSGRKPYKGAAKKTVKTKGGNYPVYKKSSAKAQSFRSAFAAARKAGKKTFTWNGRKYTTKVK